MALKRLTEGQAKFFVFEEVLLIVLSLVQLYILLGLDLPIAGFKLFANPAPPVQNVLWFVGTMVIFVTAYFFIAARDRNVIKIHNNFSKVVFGVSKKKILGVDRNVAILLITEFVFAIVIAFSVYIYLDPEVNLVPWPFNWIAFIAFLALGYYLFSQTKLFREANYESGYLVQKIRPAERLFPTRRMTSIRGEVTRIASKTRYSVLRHEQKEVKTVAHKRAKRPKKAKTIKKSKK